MSVLIADQAAKQTTLQEVLQRIRDNVDSKIVGEEVTHYKNRKKLTTVLKKPEGNPIVIRFEAIAPKNGKHVMKGFFFARQYLIDGVYHDLIIINTYESIFDAAEDISVDEDICETIEHEYYHKVAYDNDIQDVSRGSQYHNGAFEQIGRLVGNLKLVKTDKNGWGTPSPAATDQFKTFLREEVRPNFGGSFQVDPVKKEKKPSSQIKLVCPKCGIKVAISRKQYESEFRGLTCMGDGAELEGN